MCDDKLQRVYARIEKLLALANNAGAADNEAAIALRQARKLIDQYQLDETSFDTPKDASAFEEVPVGKPTRGTPVWMQVLAIGIARLNDCRVVKTGEREDQKTQITFLGLKGDGITSAHMYEYLTENGRNRCDAYLGGKFTGDNEARMYARYDFKLAYANALRERIMELVEEREREFEIQAENSAGTSLVVVKKDLMEQQYGKENYGRAPTRRPKARAAVNAGWLEGMSANINREIQE